PVPYTTHLYTLSLHDALPIYVITRAHGKGDDRHRCRLVVTARKNACVTNVKIGDVMGMGPLVRNRRLGITSKPADSGFVQAGSGDRKSTRLNSSHVKISYAVF